MSTSRTPRIWREPPIAFQILVLLFGGLVVAQLVTLMLTMVVPPAPPAQHDMRDVVAALRDGRGAGNLTRTVQARPPDVNGPGWFTAEESRNSLASLLSVPRDEVRLSFYAPLPFAGVSTLPPPPPPPARPAGDVGDAADALPLSPVQPVTWSVDPQPLRGNLPAPAKLMLIDQPGGAPPGAVGGGFPGGGFPGNGNPGSGFPRQGMPGTQAHPGWGEMNRGSSSADTIRNDLNRSAGAPSPADLAVQPVGPHAAEHMEGAGLGTHTPPPTPAIQDAGARDSAGMPVGLADERPGVENAQLPKSIARETQPPATRDKAVPISRREPSPPAISAPQQAAPKTPQVPDRSVLSTPVRRRDDAGSVSIPVQPQTRALFGLAPAPFVEGDFVAATRLADGRWAVVQPAAEGFPNAWQRRVLLWFTVAFALVAPIGWLYARHIVKPLMRFTNAAEQLGRDPSATPVALDGPAEIGRAAHAFNVMQSRLRSFVDDRTAMVGAISHDLRTPLTRLRFRIEEVDDDSIRVGMIEEVSEMEAMIASVLSFIRDASTPNARERLDLGMLVEDVAHDAKMIGSDVEVEALAPAPVEIDVLGMRRLLANLVENAVKYGDRARIRMRVEQDAAIAEIEDDGPGIPEDEMERAFEPFYRASNATNSDKKGTGLGLAVCRSIARAHGGDVVLVRSSEGFVAQLRLPLAYDAARLAA